MNFQKFQIYFKEWILEKWKYKVIWVLRSLENEINEEGRIIIVDGEGVKTRQFTTELTEKIIDLIKKMED